MRKRKINRLEIGDVIEISGMRLRILAVWHGNRKHKINAEAEVLRTNVKTYEVVKNYPTSPRNNPKALKGF